jgi:DNA-binding NarL/FixJ family response regulator
MTSKAKTPDPIRIGLLAAEPIRVAGLASIFDLPAEKGQAQLIPVIGAMPELTAMADIEYLVLDLHSSDNSLQTLERVRLTRPDIRLIVIGPEGNDELVMSSIVAGARAYLGLSAGPEIVRKAIDVVTSGSIWAPRPILSRLIDRLLKVSKVTNVSTGSQLTPREEQVLELIVKANSTREIASQLGIEQRTVKSYIGRLMRKTGADNRIKLSMSTLGRSLLSQENAREHEAEGGRIVTKQ